MDKKRFCLSSSHIILISFMAAIVIGSVLLALPISAADGKAVPYIDALFTATTSTCVTGLVTLPTVSTWSVFGQAVILFLIQIGGLGIITIMSGIMILLHKRMNIGDRLLIQDAFNLNSLSGLVRFVKKVIKGTFLVEAAGALLYMTVFIPQYGARGIWISVFNSVSAFCNAGIDIIAEDSLCQYATNPIINAVTCILIVLGGLGYIVWWDVIRVFSSKKKRPFLNLTLHSKIAIISTAVLIFVGAALFFVFEYNNALTLKDMSLYDKIQVSFFQSVTTRTAGFATISQQNLTNASSVIAILLMFIGGSPVGTAGGIKTVTFALLLSCAVSTINNKNEVTLFRRRVSGEAIKKAMAVCTTSFTIVVVSTVLLAAVCDAALLDVLYETVSATATVGLTRGLTAQLDVIGKIIIIITMYLGRVGPISLAIAFNVKRENRNLISDPIEEVSVG